MAEEKRKAPEKDGNDSKRDEAPVKTICGNAEENAAALVDEGSEVKPVEGYFLTSQRWH